MFGSNAVRSAAASAVIGSWIGYFLFTGMPQFSLLVFPQTLTLHLVLAGGVGVYLVSLAVMRRLPGGTPLDLPVIGFVASYAIATAASISWRVSLEPTLYLTAAVAVFYLLAGLPFVRSRDLRQALMLAGGGLALYALWAVGNDYADYLRLVRRVEGLSASNIFPPTVPRVHDVSDHPNVLAMVLTLVLPFFAVSAVRPARGIERWAGVLGLLVGGMAIFLTLSRAGWLGASAGIAIAAAGAWLTAEVTRAQGEGSGASWMSALPRQVTPTALAAMIGAAVLVIGGTLAFLSSASTRPGWLFRSSLSPREDAWDASLEMFADHPLVGSGPHTFGLLYPQYSGEFLEHTQHAHNGFLQVANDAGLLGLLALAGVAAALVYLLARTWREGSLEQRLIAVAASGALVGFALHNMLDAGNPWKAPAIALALVGAIVARAYREREHAAATVGTPPRGDLRNAVDRYSRPATGALLVALLVVPFAGWYWTDRAHVDYYRGADAYNRREPGVIERLQDAVDADSSNVAYRLLLGQALARAYVDGGETDALLIDRAVVHLEQAVQLDKRSDIARANLARAYQLADRDDDAAREAQVARLAVHHVPPVLAAAEVYEAIGRDTDAIDTYAQVLSMDASLADSTFWDGTPWRREHFAEILAGSTLTLNPCTYGSYLAQTLRSVPDAAADDARLVGAEDGCKLLLLEFPNDLTLRIALGRIMMARGDLDGALEHLRYAVDRQPDLGAARTELGRWYAAEGRIEDARSEWILGAELDQPESVMLLGDSYEPGDRPAGLEDRLRDLLEESGSSVQNDVVSIVYFRMRWGRLSPIEAIIPGGWNTAVSRLYAEMRDVLSRWESESAD